MKKPLPDGPVPLSRKARREIERELGIYIDLPMHSSRSTKEELGLYDEDEVYVGDVAADGLYFTALELRDKIKKIFRMD